MKISKILILFAALLPIAAYGVPLDLATSGDNNAQRRTKNNANFTALNDGKVELLGSMTETARDLLTPGLWNVILNTTADEFQVWDGAAWRRVDGMDAATVKTLYESNSDTNALTDALKAKLDFLTITQAVDLDTLESNVTTNNAKASGHTIQDEGSGLAQETVLDFQGAGVTVTAGSGKTIVTIPGGSGSFDATAQDALTWSDGANASNIWTFDVSGIDPTIEFGNNLITIGADLDLDGNDILNIGDLIIANLIMSGDMEIPNGAAPVVDTDGQVALDTTVADLSHGVIRYFGGEEMVVIAIPAAELGSLADGVIPRYNATNDEFELVSGIGEANTASNVGAELGVFNQKTGVDLEFNSFEADHFNLSASVFTIDFANSHSGYEAVIDLANLQGSVTDGQIPSGIARDSELPTALTDLTDDLDKTAAYDSLTDGATVTITCSATKAIQNATVTLGGNRTLAISGAANGMTGILIVKQDATGSRTLALPAGSLVVDGGSGAVTLSTAANAVDLLTWTYDGTNYLWTHGTNFN